MPQVHRFADFLSELQQLDRTAIGTQAPRIVEAFTRHTSFDIGALYLREGRDTPMPLCAKGQQFVAPEILDRADSAFDPPPHLTLPLRSHREEFGVLALVRRGPDEPGVAHDVDRAGEQSGRDRAASCADILRAGFSH